VRIGISTCPNDTFAFHALLAGEVRAEGLELDFTLLDVEELNRRLLAGELDAAKTSFHAALARAEDVVVLPSGSALGFGVGPLVVGGRVPRAGARPRVLCPGRWTTAHLLWRLFHDGEGDVEHVVFSEIFPALQAGRADLGVCIHEGRFTWKEAGLAFHEDLGATWERATGAPLPLGGIVARRALGPAAAHALQDAIRASLEWGLAHREACLPTMRRHAQELDDPVLWAHVDLYVNERTLDLGAEGRAALAALSARARERGLLPPGAALAVLGDAERLFHVTPWPQWERLRDAQTELRPPSLAAEGFVHLSYQGQLAGTLRAHFQGAGRLALLELDPLAVAGELRAEPSRGGASFPHLYRALRRGDVLGAWPLEPEAAFALPPEAS
jgi:1,4-dihydroxy-6-naphthoate synthase